MKIYKNAERILKTNPMIQGFKANGFAVKNLGEYCKWAEVERGKIQKTMTVYKVSGNGIDAYFLSDSLNRVACELQKDKAEVFGWLKDHGYKPVKKWYIEDYGMSEETWNEWNGIGTEEE